MKLLFLVQKEQDLSKEAYKHETNGTGFETVKELLDEAEKKITFLKAGKSLAEYLGDESGVSQLVL